MYIFFMKLVRNMVADGGDMFVWSFSSLENLEIEFVVSDLHMIPDVSCIVKLETLKLRGLGTVCL